MQSRSQSGNTAIRLTPRVSHGEIETYLRIERCSYLIWMTCWAFLWCPLTGIFVVYFLYRKHKFMSGSRYTCNTTPDERNKERKSARIAMFLILVSAVLLLVMFYANTLARLDFNSRDSNIFVLFFPILCVIASCSCGYWCEAYENKLLSRYTCPGILLVKRKWQFCQGD